MPRPPRVIVADWCYHFLNRANEKAEIFHASQDYDHFLALVQEAQTRVEVPILAACLMPNHVHFVVRPSSADDLARWAHWLFSSHAHRYRGIHGSSGHVWQGRYKIFAIQTDRHLLTVMRYVERNALAGKLVARAESWRWGSLRWRNLPGAPLSLAMSPAPLPADWVDYVNQPQTAAELAAIRTCIDRQRPFGNEDWVKAAARQLNSDQSLEPIGRPPKPRNGALL